MSLSRLKRVFLLFSNVEYVLIAFNIQRTSRSWIAKLSTLNTREFFLAKEYVYLPFLGYFPIFLTKKQTFLLIDISKNRSFHELKVPTIGSDILYLAYYISLPFSFQICSSDPFLSLTLSFWSKSIYLRMMFLEFRCRFESIAMQSRASPLWAIMRCLS